MIPSRRRLLKFTDAALRCMHGHLVSVFGISSVDGQGITPASHRGGGATHRYRSVFLSEHIT